MLDNILEESVDQHFHALIQTRHMQRRHDVIDDNLTAEVVEEIGDSIWEPPEVQNLLVFGWYWKPVVATNFLARGLRTTSGGYSFFSLFIQGPLSNPETGIFLVLYGLRMDFKSLNFVGG